MTGFISLLCCEGCRGSSEQNDAPFAGTLSFWNTTAACLQQEKLLKVETSQQSQLLQVQGWPVLIQPRATGSARWAGKQAGRGQLQKAEHLGALAIHTVPDLSGAQQLKISPMFSLVD